MVGVLFNEKCKTVRNTSLELTSLPEWEVSVHGTPD